MRRTRASERTNEQDGRTGMYKERRTLRTRRARKEGRNADGCGGNRLDCTHAGLPQQYVQYCILLQSYCNCAMTYTA
eukprot:COSAG06_NODE_365_length_16774_cov_42.676882_27_plen_77_part_00